MALTKTLGKNVRTWRQARGLSQEEFAHRANLHPTYVSGIERGRRNPTVSVIERMAAALKVAPASLLNEGE